MGQISRRTIALVVSVAFVAVGIVLPASASADDGDPASYFGSGGVAEDHDALDLFATDMVATDDSQGNIYVGYTGSSAIGIIKYFFDGERDTSFGVDGVFSFVVPDGYVVSLADLAVRDDGSIVAGGIFPHECGGSLCAFSFVPTLAIVDAAGTSAQFPETPVFDIYGADRSVTKLVLLPDGRTMVIGKSEMGSGARVIEPNNVIRSVVAFPRQPAIASNEQFAFDGIVLADGHVLVEVTTPPSGCRIFGLSSSLGLDPAFGTNGAIDIPCGELAAEPSGSWLWHVNTPDDLSLKRYSVSGELVSSFTRGDPANDVQVDGTGRIFLTESVTSAVSAYNPDLSVDTSFGTAGSADIEANANDGFLAMVSGDLLFYRIAGNPAVVYMQVLENPYGLAPQPPALPMSSLVPLAPDRVLDTRVALGAPPGKPTAGATVNVQVTGVAEGVPDDGSVVAVVMNVTAAEAAGNGYVTVWPTGGVLPTVSSLNYRGDGRAIPNLVTVAIGVGGEVSLFTSASTHLLVDVLGYYRRETGAVSAGRFQAVAPERIVDTRSGLGAPMAPIVAGGTIDVQLTGVAGVPSDGVSAVAFNLTATRSTSNGFLTAFPADADRPDASNLNVQAAGTRANFVISPVSPDGKVTIFSSGGADVLIDIVGWFTDDTASASFDGLFVPITPRRIVDTRYGGAASRPVNSVLVKQVGSTLVGPAYGVTGAAVLNLTVVGPLQSGYVTAWPTGIVEPVVSSLNVANDQATRANAAIVVLGDADDGGFQVAFHTPAHLIVDIVGYYLSFDGP